MYFEDIKEGTEIAIAPAVIEKEKMISFAKNYDNILLHTDEEYAKNTTFGKLIALGYAYNQNGVLVLTDVTEAIVKKR